MNRWEKREVMERWLPLLQIFLNSPTPEGDASLWFQQQQQPPSTPHHPTSAFLSLLETFTQRPPAPLWIQTLPPATQSRILSFLAAERGRFCPRRLRSLAAHILRSPDHPGFWVHRAARHLFDAVSSPVQQEEQHHQHPEKESQEEEEFSALPDWLQAHVSTTAPLLPWLPLLPALIPNAVPHAAAAFREKPRPMEKEEEAPPLKPPTPAPRQPLDPQDRDRAFTLKTELLASDSTSQALRLSDDIRHLCLGSGAGNQLVVLGLIEPWRADDETASVLLTHLPGDDGVHSVDWPAHVLCSIALPKLLLLHSPASRALLSATIRFCKLHQRETVEALLFPLVLHKGGIGVHLCDVLARIIKECLHPAHVSAFCQRLLSWEGEGRRGIYQHCHQELIADEVVWTEPLFTLFQHILNQDVYLTPDSTDQLVSVVEEMAGDPSSTMKGIITEDCHTREYLPEFILQVWNVVEAGIRLMANEEAALPVDVRDFGEANVSSPVFQWAGVKSVVDTIPCEG